MYAKFAGTKKAKQNNLVALSFDDGPHPENTPEVLEILKGHRAHATFFWIVENAVSLLRNNPTLFNGIISEIKTNQHEIGLHAPSDSKPTLSSRLFGFFSKPELAEAKKTLEDITGTKVSHFRPHYLQAGSSIIYAQELGMTTVLGNPISAILFNLTNFQKITTNQVNAGSILIFHDEQSRSPNQNFVPNNLSNRIRELKRRGLIVTTVSEVLEN